MFRDYCGDSSVSVKTQECQDAGWLVEAIEVVKGISNSSGDLFSLKESKNRISGKMEYVIKERAKLSNGLFLLLYNQFAAELVRLFPRYIVNPYLSSFVENQKFFEISRLVGTPHVPIKSTPDQVKALNCYVEAIRQDAKLPSFRRLVKNFERSSNKNHKSLMGYIDDLFSKYSKVLTVRLDLEYMVDDVSYQSMGLRLLHQDVFEHRESFFIGLANHLKKLLGKSVLIGYAWKLEYGPRNGWHYHTLIFLNGQKSCEDITIGNLVGDYWKCVTGNIGRYYNCNRDKRRYQNLGTLGIGLINHHDRDVRQHLEGVVASYLTKVDQCVKLQLPDGARSFGRGTMRGSGSRKGRPRSKAAIASTVES